ncbi:MAG: hypothetical protein NZ522_06785, partial [Chitinophagales bacterium]|nr:hypothetical protein [Chitinophagales bacterium]
AGIYGNGIQPAQASVTGLWERFVYDNTGAPRPVDTILRLKDEKFSLFIPYCVGGGITLGNESYWLVGADFRYTNWSNYENDYNDSPLNDSWRGSVGFQFVPNSDSRSMWGKLMLRAGAYFGQSIAFSQSNSINEAGGTLGIGIPLTRKTLARINLAADIGQRGIGQSDNISETYSRLYLSFVLNDIWFIKRKFD